MTDLSDAGATRRPAELEGLSRLTTKQSPHLIDELVRFLVRFVYTKAHVLAPAIKHHASSDTRLNNIFHGLTRYDFPVSSL